MTASAPGRNLAHRVSLSFEEDPFKFSGEIKGFLDEYDFVGHEFGLSEEQKLRYLHNLLSGDAKRFNLSEMEPLASFFVDGVTRIRAEYHSAVHQRQAQRTLGSLRLANYIAKGMPEQEALEPTEPRPRWSSSCLRHARARVTAFTTSLVRSWVTAGRVSPWAQFYCAARLPRTVWRAGVTLVAARRSLSSGSPCVSGCR